MTQSASKLHPSGWCLFFISSFVNTVCIDLPLRYASFRTVQTTSLLSACPIASFYSLRTPRILIFSGHRLHVLFYVIYYQLRILLCTPVTNNNSNYNYNDSFIITLPKIITNNKTITIFSILINIEITCCTALFVILQINALHHYLTLRW